MKIVVFGLPNQVDEKELLTAMAQTSSILGVAIKIQILERDDLLPPATEPIFIQRRKETEFIQAVKGVMKVCGDIVRNPADRAGLYKAVIDKTIERPILEVIAFGPKCGADINALKDAGGNEFVAICRTALSLSNSL